MIEVVMDTLPLTGNGIAMIFLLDINKHFLWKRIQVSIRFKIHSVNEWNLNIARRPQFSHKWNCFSSRRLERWGIHKMSWSLWCRNKVKVKILWQPKTITETDKWNMAIYIEMLLRINEWNRNWNFLRWTVSYHWQAMQWWTL